MTGLDLARNVRETRPDFPVILMTDERERPRHDDVFAAGVTALVVRPYLPIDIREAVMRVLVH